MSPQVVRALFRVEMAGGGVREFEAEHPAEVECHIERTVRCPEIQPVDLTVPGFIDPGNFWGVRIAFRASHDPRHKMEMRTEATRSPQAVLDEVRARAQEWADLSPSTGNLASRRAIGADLLRILDHG